MTGENLCSWPIHQGRRCHKRPQGIRGRKQASRLRLHAPFVPHGTHFWHMLFPRPYEFWLDLDNHSCPTAPQSYGSLESHRERIRKLLWP